MWAMPSVSDLISFVSALALLVSGYVAGNLLSAGAPKWRIICGWTVVSMLSGWLIVLLREMPASQGAIGYCLITGLCVVLGWFEGHWTRRI